MPKVYNGADPMSQKVRSGGTYGEVGIKIPAGIGSRQISEIREWIESDLWPEAMNQAHKSYINIEVNEPAKARLHRAREFARSTAEEHGFLDAWLSYLERERPGSST